MQFGSFGYNGQFGFNAPPAPAAAAVAAYASWPSLIGAEMMVNGDCSSGTGWEVNGGTILIGTGKLRFTAATDTQQAFQDFTPVEGASYRVDYTADSVTLGGVQAFIGSEGVGGTVRTAPGTYSQDITAGLYDGFGFALVAVGASTTAVLDNFSVKSVGLLGVEADWTFSDGSVYWEAAAQAPFFDGAAEGAYAELTGSAKTALDAAVSNNTACTVTLTNGIAGFSFGATTNVTVVLKGGTPVVFTFAGAALEQVVHTVTSGAGSGCRISAGVDGAGGSPARIQITPA